MDKVKVSSQKLSNICDDLIVTILKKNHDYGDAWQNHGALTTLVNMENKLLRLKTIQSKVALVESETVADTVEDLVCYGLLWLMRQKELDDVAFRN